MPDQPVIDVPVGKVIRVPWSNGHGFSLYTVNDDPGCGQHWLSLKGEYEYACNGSGLVKVR